ncbi:hypothetical protein JKP88DRAFT_265489 [Tribonema minus]|uniref:OBG-type G domain-containing protein n=1 Tax=Tribonema minus TaxID=303371 RepID=A0A835YKB1_9STRA|nr:hypothetical protein JKP88DRAFT_265489 [Tribonema minus]
MKVLCLHGARQTSEVFRHRLRKLQHKAPREVQFVYIDAPHELPISQHDDVATRHWWLRQGSAYTGMDASLAAIDTAWAQHGPFDMILGFSAGAVAAAAAAHLPTHFPGLRFCLLAGGPCSPHPATWHICPGGGRPSNGNVSNGRQHSRRNSGGGGGGAGAEGQHAAAAAAAGAAAVPTCVKSLHVMGEADRAVPIRASRELAELFTLPQVHVHAQGHCLPTRSADIAVYMAFLGDCLAELRGSDGAASAAAAPLPPQRQRQRQNTPQNGSAAPLPAPPPPPAKPAVAVPPPEPPLSAAEAERYSAAQEEELESLEAIYAFGGEFAREQQPVAATPTAAAAATAAQQQRACSVALEWRGALPRPVALRFVLPPRYPDAPPAAALVHALNMMEFSSAAQAGVLAAARGACAELAGEPMIYAAVAAANEFLQSGGCERAIAAATAAPPPPPAAAAESEDDSESSDSDGGSTFNKEAMRAATAAAAAAAAATAGDGEGEEGAAEAQSAGSRGAWQYTVGLVGKPSAGKSTLFNCATRSQAARVAAHPFTTIDPNVGRGWWAAPPPTEAEKLCASRYGRTPQGHRLMPLIVKDVAGLVPGAYEGRGKGNQFLNDLCDADVLVHVVDASGRSDRNGNVLEGESAYSADGDPLDDIRWVREEIHLWIYGNVRRKWTTILKRPQRLAAMFSGYGAPRWLVKKALDAGGLDPALPSQAARAAWTEAGLHLVVAHFLRLRFPMLLALNKVDVDGGAQQVDRILKALPGTGHAEGAVPLSAAAESWLQSSAEAGAVSYTPGAAAFAVTRAPEAGAAAFDAECARARGVLSRWGSTGVVDVMTAACMLRPPVLCWPVGDLDALTPPGWRHAGATAAGPSQPPKMLDCIALKPGTTVGDVFELLRHGSESGAVARMLNGEYVRGEGMAADGSARRQLRREHVVGRDCAVLKIMANRKAVWQGAGGLHDGSAQQEPAADA